jgi:hypothetical protein
MTFRRNNNNFRGRRSRKSNARMLVRSRPVDPIITAQRFPVPATHIPQHNVAPSVTRTVRLLRNLISASPSYLLTRNDISIQDAIDYTTSSAALRYENMRVIQVRVWAESPNSLSVSQSPYGLIVTEYTSGFAITDNPITGSRLNAVGLRFPFNVRTAVFICTDTTPLVAISCTQSIAATTNFLVTIDVTVEFYG